MGRVRQGVSKRGREQKGTLLFSCALAIQARGGSKGIRAACPARPNTPGTQAFFVLNVVTRRGALQCRSQPLGRAMLQAPPADIVHVERLRPLHGQHVTGVI
jgi:hypothetical protein